MDLALIWFILIAVLWTGYLVLEGFDFGVGMLLPVIGRNEPERRAMLRTIGPVWDGNEVWVLVAGGATFAAFPEWYATLFSGFYIALFAILLGLIFRGVAIEYRNKRASLTWRTRWDWTIAIASFVPALLWGVAFGNIVQGVPIDADGEFTGSFFTLLNPYALLAGATTTLLFLAHGAHFLALKTEGVVRERANRLAWRVGLVAAVAAVAFLGWTLLLRGNPAASVAVVLAAVCLVGAILANRVGREGWAFLGTSLTIGLAVVVLFLVLFPDVMPSSTNPAYSLTIENASSTPYTLGIMTIVAVLFVPIVLVYQGWTYWVFRKRVAGPPTPVEP
jgi:cytochrome bd ubiquinol oxidase subunit II